MIRATQITVTGSFVGATSIAQVSFPFTFWFDLFYFIFSNTLVIIWHPVILKYPEILKF
jgi:hypothetical protein